MNLVTEIKKTQLTKDDLLIVKLKETVDSGYQDKVFDMLVRMRKEGDLKCPFILTQDNIMSFEVLKIKEVKNQFFKLLDEWWTNKQKEISNESN